MPTATLHKVKTCPQCGKRFGVDPKYPANFKRQKFCGNACAQVAKKHSPERVMASFWSMVDKTGECWLWTGYRQPDGYGQFRANSKFYNSHKYAYELAYGPVPKGLEVMHTCDQPHCCNVAHMRLGTHLDNMRDCYNKRRHAFGEGAKRAKLTEEQVRELRTLRDKGWKFHELGAQFGISSSHACNIYGRKAWRLTP